MGNHFFSKKTAAVLSLLALITGCGATPPEVKAYKEVSPENTETTATIRNMLNKGF